MFGDDARLHAQAPKMAFSTETQSMDIHDIQRRRVVAGLLAGGGLLASGKAGASPPRRARHAPARVGIAVVGLGEYAAFVLERLASCRTAYPAALVTGSKDKARAIAARYGIPDIAIHGYDDYARLADDETIAAVHICLPVGLHAPHALKALAAGKHVLCEKPLAATAAEARTLADAARDAGKVLMPAYRAWFSDAVQDALGRCREGTHGALASVDAHKGFHLRQPAGNWRFDPALSGGGCLTDIGIYSVQLQRWACGGLPRSITAVAHRRPGDARFAQVESDIGWVAQFDDGVLATGSASWRYRLQNRLRLGFEQAWLDLDPATPAMGERMRLGLDGPNRVEELMFPLRDQVPRMYEAFADACLGRSAPPVAASEGIADLVMMEAIRQAAASGTTVALPAG